MIRINLLGQARPKAAKQAVPLEATVQILFALRGDRLVAVVVLGITYYQQKHELDETNKTIASLQAEKASLQQIKQDVDRFESQKAVLQQRIDVIETLQKNRTGGQELLQMVANTVVRIDSLWLTSRSQGRAPRYCRARPGRSTPSPISSPNSRRPDTSTKSKSRDAKENDLLPVSRDVWFLDDGAMQVSCSSADSGQATPRLSRRHATAPATSGQGEELSHGDRLPRLALAPAGAVLCGIDVRSRSGWVSTFRISPFATVRTQLEAAQSRNEAARSGSPESARVQAAPRGIAIRDGRASEAARNACRRSFPEDKQTDQFILMVQSAALSSGVAIRS